MRRLSLRTTLALAGILITIGGCAENPSSSVGADSSWQKIARADGPSFSRSGSESASVLIGPAGGVIETAGHKLVFPAGALAEATVITMTADPAYVGVELQPHGLQFPRGSEPTLTLSLNGASVQGFSRLTIAYMGDNGEILEILPTSGLGSSGKYRTSLQHFSGYVLNGN